MSANTTIGIPLDGNDTLILRLFGVMYIQVNHDNIRWGESAAPVTSVVIGVGDGPDILGLTPEGQQALKDWAHIKFNSSVKVEIR